MLRILAALLAAALATAPCAAQAAPDPAGTDRVSLAPGDVLRVEIWREKDLSGDFQVDTRGAVTLPLLGERRVAGVPMAQLREQLLADYRVTLRNPSIGLVPLRRVNVLGEVNRPGSYLVDPTVSLAGAVALAGGTNGGGDLRRIRIVRDGTVIPGRVAPEASLTVADVRSGDQIFVDRRSWWERNSGIFTSAVVSTTLSIVTALILRK
jgi:protein involved in polysaccharide export with SLBB domain